MDRLRQLLVIAFLAGYQQISFAQKNNSIIKLNEIDTNLNEAIFVSTNTNSFLTGETLLYKIFCLDKTTNTPAKYSKLAYFELIDIDKKVVVKHKLFLKDGTSNGDFFIPTTLKTGIYKIVGYTNWMLNKDAREYFSTDIYILNPYTEKPVTASESSSSQKEFTTSDIKSDNISFDLKNKTFNNRTKVEFKINSKSEDFLKGNYVVTVRKTDGYLSQNKVVFNDYQANNPNTNYNSKLTNPIFTLPELRGEIISGRITSNKEAIKNKKVALSIVGKNYDLKLTTTDEQGKFLFNLEHQNSNPNIVIQLIEYDKENYTIEIDKPKDIDFSNVTFSNLQFNTDSNKNITERLISSQVENAYYNIKKDSLITPNNFIPFFGSLSKEFKLDDFTRFPTMEETITEVVSGVIFRKENKVYFLHVFDYDENYESPIPPLVLVDGLILDDLNEFFTYNPKNIYSVNVVKGLYYYGSKSFNGIVAFTTKTGDYETKLKGSFIIRPELLRPQGKKEYYQPDYTDNKNVRIPDYRHQLLWDPNVDLSNPQTNIAFYTSDITGKFEIILEGFSANGKPVFIKEIIEVKDTTSN